MSIYDITVPTPDGGSDTLGEHRRQVLLIVNVATKCGYTPQYASLQQLHAQHADQGFSVIGFPCNQFLFQEPCDASSISACGTSYGVTFPVLGRLKSQRPPPPPAVLTAHHHDRRERQSRTGAVELREGAHRSRRHAPGTVLHQGDTGRHRARHGRGTGAEHLTTPVNTAGCGKSSESHGNRPDPNRTASTFAPPQEHSAASCQAPPSARRNQICFPSLSSSTPHSSGRWSTKNMPRP